MDGTHPITPTSDKTDKVRAIIKDEAWRKMGLYTGKLSAHILRAATETEGKDSKHFRIIFLPGS